MNSSVYWQEQHTTTNPFISLEFLDPLLSAVQRGKNMDCKSQSGNAHLTMADDLLTSW